MKNNELRPQELTTPWYKKASLPWTILSHITVAAAFVAIGWMLHANQMGQVKAEAASLSESITKNVQVKAEAAPSK